MSQEVVKAHQMVALFATRLGGDETVRVMRMLRSKDKSRWDIGQDSFIFIAPDKAFWLDHRERTAKDIPRRRMRAPQG
ncbi:MAG: hypothetical protein ACUVTY_15175 [Armatimonadota bacterium]